MVSFILSLVALILGYLLYGRFVEKVFGPDDRVTPAVAKADGVDYLVLPGWKIFMIQFLTGSPKNLSAPSFSKTSRVLRIAPILCLAIFP